MADNKTNIESPSVEQLIPQQLVGDSQALIEFLKEYYKFLNQDQGPTQVINTIVQNKDLDDAVDAYIDMVRKEIGYGIATKLEANKVNLYKHIGEFYRSKGSIDSFKLLFRLLFNKNVEISLPKEQILVASDGRWVQQTSLFVNVSAGNAFDLVNSFVTINNTDGSSVIVEVERVRKYNDSGIFELIISRLFVGQINNAATFIENSITGTVIDSLSAYSVTYSGQTGFKVGQLLDVVSGSITGTKVKVTSVNVTGGITGIEFLEFGANYPSTVTLQISVDTSSLNNSILIGSLLTDTSAENIEALKISDPEKAIISFTNTAVSRYSGSYSTNKGFLSDDIYLQDNYYYQQYSYAIKADEQFSQYEGIVKQTIHPSGMIMFGEFEITNQIDATAAIQLLGRLYRGFYRDEVRTDDTDTIFDITKPLAHTATTSQFVLYEFTKGVANTDDIINTSDLHEKFSTKPLAHTATTSQHVYRNITKPFEELIDAQDSNLVEGPQAYANDYFLQDYSTDLTIDTLKGYKWNLTKPHFENITTSQIDPIFNFTKSNTDLVNTSQTVDKNITKPIFNYVDGDDQIQTIDTQKVLSTNVLSIDELSSDIDKPLPGDSINTIVDGMAEINPYSPFYFEEHYSGGARSDFT